MRTLALALALVAAACSGGSSTTPDPQPVSEPAPTEPAPTDPAAPADPAALMTPEDCTAKGGTVKGDIGDGKVACDAGQRELGKVKTGIEGGVCCAPPTP